MSGKQNIALACVLVLFGVALFAVEHYARPIPRTRQTISRVLAVQVRDGMSRDEVERLIGPGVDVSVAEQEHFVQAVRRWQVNSPDLYPLGSATNDEFVYWPLVDTCTLMLQFREGLLINHSPKSFAEVAGL